MGLIFLLKIPKGRKHGVRSRLALSFPNYYYLKRRHQDHGGPLVHLDDHTRSDKGGTKRLMAVITIATNEGIVFDTIENITIKDLGSQFAKATINLQLDDALRRAIASEQREGKDTASHRV